MNNFKKGVVLFFLLLCSSCPANPSLAYLNRMLTGKISAAARSGRRISSGRQLLTDNPADYMIYEQLAGYLKGLNRTIANTADMLSYYRYEGGILRTTLKPLQRIRELILKRSGGILSRWQRNLINREIRLLYQHIWKTVQQSSFNGVSPFRKLLQSKRVRSHFSSARYYTFSNVNRLLKFFLRRIAVSGALFRRLQHRTRTQQTRRENRTKYQSRIDTNVGMEMSRFKQNQLQLMVNMFLLKIR